MRYRPCVLGVVVILIALLLPAVAGAADVSNESGRFATTTLVDLGETTSALYVFVSDGTSFEKQLFWQSEPGGFDVAKAKLGSGDLNNDGKPDALVLYDLGKGQSALYAFLSDGASYSQTTAWQGVLAWRCAKLCIADANGDGADDAYVFSQTSASKSTLSTFTSSSTPTDTAAPAAVTMTRATVFSGKYAASSVQIAATDANGDGKDELVSLCSVSKTKARLDVFTTKRTTFWQGSLAAAKARLSAGDVDSDGKGDVVLLTDSGKKGSALLVARSTGSTFAAPKAWWKSGAGKLEWARARLALGDVTSDGKADVVLQSQSSATTSTMSVAVSSGSAFTGSTFWSGDLAFTKSRLACSPPTALVIPETTEVLPPATVEDASTTDGSTYTFASPAQTASLASGDVIVGEPTENLPDGIFRKVTAVTGATVFTEGACLEDAISNGEFAAEHTLTESDFTDSATNVPGVTLESSRADGADSRLITLRLKNVDISKSWNLSAGLGPVLVSGTITLRVTVNVSGKMSWGKVTGFEVSETTTVASDLRASISSDVSFGSEKTLITWGAGQLLGFTVWVGPVPLYFQPELSIFVGANGKFTAGVETSVHYDASGSLGMKYNGQTFTAWAGVGASRSYQPPTLYASGSVKAYGGAQLGLKLYTAAGPYIRMDGYLKLVADTRATPWWTLKAGLEASMGAQIGVNAGMIHWNKDWRSGDLNLGEWTLAQASSSPDQADLTGRWNGLWGSDNIREVLFITGGASGSFSGSSFFENRSGDRNGQGTVQGTISGSSVHFALTRDGGVFYWSGALDSGNRRLMGTFQGYSNDATYVRQ